MRAIISAIVFLLFHLCATGQDIKSSVSGFSAEVDLVYSEWHTNSWFLGNLAELEPAGGGLTFKVGYGFRERVEIFASYQIANFLINEEWDRFVNTNAKLGVRIHFGATLKKFRPFLGVGITNNRFLIDPIYIGETEGPFELSLNGVGFAPEGGLNYFLTANLALTGNLSFAFGNFHSTEISGQVNEFDEKLDYTFFNIGLGMSYFFQ